MQTYNLTGLSILTRHAFEAAIKSVETFKGGIEYCEKALSSDIENWERKEYAAVLEDRRVNLVKAKEHLQYLLKLHPEVLI